MNVLAYINYFRQFAITNLQHVANSENLDSNSKLSQTFAVYNVDDITANMRTTIAGDKPCLFVSMYDTRIDTNEYKSEFKAYGTGSLLMVQYPISPSIEHRLAAFEACETKLYLLIERLINDAQTGNCHLFHSIDINSITITAEENLFTGMYGYYMKFNFFFRLPDLKISLVS